MPGSSVPVCYRHPDRETYVRCTRCDRPICPEDMVSASVGFQCPDDARAGAAAVRQPRTTYGGTVTDGIVVTQVLIGLNVLVFLATALGGTSLLILVNVTIDTVQQIQSHLLAHQYADLIKKAKLKGKMR